MGAVNSNFCIGSFPVAVDDAWWAQWGMAQRDVVIMHKDAQGAWQVFCHFSMDQHTAGFGTVVEERLAAALGDTSNSADPMANTTTATTTTRITTTMTTTTTTTTTLTTVISTNDDGSKTYVSAS